MPKLPTSQVCFRLSRCESYGELPAPIWRRRWRAVERPMRRLGIYNVYVWNIMRSTLLSSRWRECTILVGLPTAINTRRRRRRRMRLRQTQRPDSNWSAVTKKRQQARREQGIQKLTKIKLNTRCLRHWKESRWRGVQNSLLSFSVSNGFGADEWVSWRRWCLTWGRFINYVIR